MQEIYFWLTVTGHLYTYQNYEQFKMLAFKWLRERNDLKRLNQMRTLTVTPFNMYFYYYYSPVCEYCFELLSLQTEYVKSELNFVTDDICAYVVCELNGERQTRGPISSKIYYIMDLTIRLRTRQNPERISSCDLSILQLKIIRDFTLGLLMTSRLSELCQLGFGAQKALHKTPT